MQSTQPTTCASNLNDLRDLSGEIYMESLDESLESTLQALTQCCTTAIRVQDENNSIPQYFEVIRGVADSNIDPKKSSAKYDGGIYRNAFKVSSGSILLESVGFFGPVEKEAEYTIKVIVEEPLFELNYSCYCCIPREKMQCKIYGSTAKQKVKCEKGEFMFIHFNEPILIKENKWYGLTFSIEGKEKTARIAEGKQRTEVEVKVGENGEKRTFFFTMGSCQMPIIRFRTLA